MFFKLDSSNLGWILEHRIACLVFCASILLVHHHWKKRKIYRFASRLDGPFAWPLIGNATMFFCAPNKLFQIIHGLFLSFLMREVRVSRVWIFGECYISFTDATFISAILNKNLKKSKFYSLMDELLQNGILVNSNIPKWRASRKLILPVFHFNILKTYIKIFHSETLILVTKWKSFAEKKVAFNPDESLNLATFDMVMMSTLGINPRAQNEENGKHEFSEAMDENLKIMMTRMLNPLLHNDFIFWLTPNFNKMNRNSKILRNFCQSTLNEIRNKIKSKRKLGDYTDSEINGFDQNWTEKPEEFEKDPNELNHHGILNETAKSFAELLMEAPDYTEGDDEELVCQILTVIAAGQDTTKTQNAVALILLALHPDIQEKVIEEVDSVFGVNKNHCPTYEDLCKLEYLEWVIKETLRLFPAGLLISRYIDEDFILEKDLVLPAGVTALISIYSLHRSPQYYKNPNKFDPNRWTPEEISKRSPNCYFPFSMGPRNCIGAKYAMMQMKTVLSTILRHYKIRPSTECNRMEDIRFGMLVTMKLDENCKILLERRFDEKMLD